MQNKIFEDFEMWKYLVNLKKQFLYMEGSKNGTSGRIKKKTWTKRENV